MPGEPPPEPMSTTAPSYRSTSGSARSASSSSISRAWSRSPRAVSPGVATTALSQSLRNDDDVAVRLPALGGRSDSRDFLQTQVDDLALARRHRLEFLALARLAHLLCNAKGKRLERRLTPGAIARRVDDDVPLLLAVGAVRDHVEEVLDRVDRLA